MYKKRQNSPDAHKRKIERIKKYYEDLNSDKERVAKYVREKVTEALYESDKTRFQLQEKLYKKIVKDKHESLVEDILDSFEERGFLNEERFVENFIRMKYHAYNGLTKIKNELKKRGVKIEEYLHILEEYDFKESAFEYVERKSEGKEYTEKDFEKLQRKLVSRGFSFQEASNAMSQIQVKSSIVEDEEDVDLEPARNFIEKRMKKGYGRQKIEQEIKYKGIQYTKEIFEEFDFFQAAFDYKIKKYGSKKETDYNTINKQKQHMLSRGFSFDEISECF